MDSIFQLPVKFSHSAITQAEEEARPKFTWWKMGLTKFLPYLASFLELFYNEQSRRLPH
jgi:hypothetical protein